MEQSGAYLLSGAVSAKKYRGEPQKMKKIKYPGENAFPAALLSHPPRDHIELCPSPEERPAHPESISVRNASGAVIGY
jgi:hypothetical protein